MEQYPRRAVAIGKCAIIFVLPLYLINALELSMMSADLVLTAMSIGVYVGCGRSPRCGAVWVVVRRASSRFGHGAEYE